MNENNSTLLSTESFIDSSEVQEFFTGYDLLLSRLKEYIQKALQEGNLLRDSSEDIENLEQTFLKPLLETKQLIYELCELEKRIFNLKNKRAKNIRQIRSLASQSRKRMPRNTEIKEELQRRNKAIDEKLKEIRDGLKVKNLIKKIY